MSLRTRKLTRWLLGSLVALVLVVGALMGALSFVVARVPEYRVQVQDWINERSGLAVEFRTLKARMRWYGPELVFDDAVVRTPDGTRVLATARRGSVGFDLWKSIGSGRLITGRFALDAPQLGLIRTRDGRIQLLGQSERSELRPFALEELPIGRFLVRDAVVSFRDETTGRGPWSLSGVNFELVRSSRSMQLNGDAVLPPALGSRLQFSATAQGPLEKSQSLVSTFNVEGERLDLAGWADTLPEQWPAPQSGQGTIHISGTMRGPELTQLSAEVDLADVTAVLPVWKTPLATAAPLEEPRPAESAAQVEPQGEPESTAESVPEPGPQQQAAATEMLSYDRIALKLRAQRTGDAWNATVSDLDLTRADSAWHAAEIHGRWERDGQGRLKLAGDADRIVLGNLWPLLAYLPESPELARLRALGARGVIEDASLDFQRDAANVAPRYALRAKVHDLAIDPVERSPGFSGVGGTLSATERGGEWQLASNGASFALPRLFRGPLTVQSLGGAIQWQDTGAGWQIRSDEIRVNSEDGSAVARFTATVPADGSSVLLDLSAQAQNLKVGATPKYIPAGKFLPKTMEWFDRAFVDGVVTDAEVILNGPLRAFPFRGNEGTFSVRGQVENAVFHYLEGYVPARELAARLEFHNEGMHVEATSAKVGDVHVTHALADIADFKDNHLIVKASAEGDVHDALHFLHSSPLGPQLGAEFARLSGQGPLSSSVLLDLPLRHLDKRNVEVNTRFRNAQLSMQGIAAPLRSLNGTLLVRNALIAAADLQGQWLDGPLSVVVQPQGRTASDVNAHGHATAPQLKALLGLPESIKLTGSTDWHVTTTLTTGAGQRGTNVRTVRVDSDLVGLGIRMPEPVGKSEAEVRPLQLTLDFDTDDALLVRGSLGTIRALIGFQHRPGGWSLDRGGLRADSIAPSLPDHRGLRIEGSVERFVLDDWLALRTLKEGGKPLSEYLRAANVRVGTFELFGYTWSDLRGMLQATPAGWRVDVSGPGAAGQILIPESFTGAQVLRGTLERLFLESSTPGATSEEADSEKGTDPRNLPNMQFHVQDMRVGPRILGTVDLKASRVPQGLRFDSISVTAPSARAEAAGHWLQTADGPQSSLTANITSSDVAATLRALNYGEFIQAKQGSIRANLAWPGGFTGNILAHASGAISADLEEGQLVNVEPGAGRVLGLFSIAALPRRLALDFRDLTDKGLAFDSVHGDFELRNGNAYTNNLLLRGPAAEIGIAGRTGLGSRDYDQTAVVTGNLGVSLPVAGALAGGPAVGAALLLFSQVFKEPLKGITRGYYRITGPWDDPVVERVDASQVKAHVNTGD
jgi:uncharacterized protein (TIGR02099 family)